MVRNKADRSAGSVMAGARWTSTESLGSISPLPLYVQHSNGWLNLSTKASRESGRKIAWSSGPENEFMAPLSCASEFRRGHGGRHPKECKEACGPKKRGSNRARASFHSVAFGSLSPLGLRLRGGRRGSIAGKYSRRCVRSIRSGGPAYLGDFASLRALRQKNRGFARVCRSLEIGSRAGARQPANPVRHHCGELRAYWGCRCTGGISLLFTSVTRCQ